MRIIIAAVVAIIVVSDISVSQNINWRALREDQQNLLQFNFGYDYGVTTQMGYARTFRMIRPAMVGLDFSFPMGNNLFDDFKVRLGGQVEVLEIGGFSATVRIASVFRRYQTPLVSIASFGSDFAVVAGYYSPTWSVGGEFGFDKSITSRLKHSEIMKESFPGIRDGWYVPTGGHFYYGIQGGKTLGETLDLSLRVGATNAQADDENAAIPYYLQMGLGVRF
jgi:hypothetical protein